MRTKLTRLDKKIFKQLEEMEYKGNEKSIILQHLKQLMLDIMHNEKNIDDTMVTLKGILVSLNNLKKSKEE